MSAAMNLRNRLLSAASIAFGFTAGITGGISELLNDLRGASTPAGGTCEHHNATGVDAPGTQNRTWESKFAKDVKRGDIVALEGPCIDLPPGLRALLVTGKESTEHQHFGGATAMIVFLLRDVDSEKPHSPQTGTYAPFQVAVDFDVPDSVPADAAGLDGGE